MMLAKIKKRLHPAIRPTAQAGDAVIFHGHLFHHAVFGQDSERFRPVLACHYIPAGYRHWPHVLM